MCSIPDVMKLPTAAVVRDNHQHEFCAALLQASVVLL
jgi:hypothetical protein